MCSTPNPTPATPRWSTRSPPRSWPPKAGYSRPHTIHCGPGGIYLFSLGGANGHDGPGGVALLDHDSFEVTGPWELDRGDQYFAYDGWWHLNHDTMITSEWGSPSMFEHGLDPEDLLGRRFGHHLNFWSMSQRRLTQRIDLGDAHQLVFEVRPAHDPAKAWGFVGVVTSVEDLSGSVWAWHRDGDRWAATKVITIPAEPADPDLLPPALKPFGAVPPLVSDIDLSVDDRWLYVSCWGTGELKQYDVADLFHPRQTGSVRLGGIVRRQPHPTAPDRPLAGGPQMLEVSRDGRRIYVTNSLYGSGTRSSTPTGSAPGWPSSTPPPRTAAGWSPTHGSSPTATTSAACGSTRPGSRAATPPATPTATPADMHPIVAHHAGEQALAPLLLLASGGVPLLLTMTQDRLTAVRQWLARSRDRGAS
jgi:methanethiol oxidase